MSGKIKGLTVELGGETTGLEAAMKDIGRAANDINKELGQVEKGLKFDSSNTVLLAQKHELLEKKIAETRKGLDLLRQAQGDVEKMYKSGEIDAGQYRAFRREIETSESKLKTFEQQVRDVEKAQKDAGKTADEWGDKLKDGAGKAALGAGAIAGAAFSTGFLGGMDVEKATDKLSAQLGATGEKAEQYGEVAANLYAGAWGDSMEDVTNAVGAVVTSIGGMEGATSSELEGMTAKVMDFATAFEVDVPRAAQVAGQMVKSGLADNATEALDLLTVSMQNVPAAVRDDIMDAVDEYGPFLASIGIEGERAFGLLVKGAEKGMYGIDKTGDALKEFTIRATDMSDASKLGYDLLGLSQEEMSRKLLEGGEVGAQAFEQIVDGLLAIEDPVAQSQAALALFGTPLEDLSVQEIPAFLEGLSTAKDSLGEVTGATEKMGQALNDNAATQLESFKRSVQQAFVEKMAEALPHMQKVFGFLTENADIVVPIAAALGAFAVVIGVVSAAMKAWAVIQVILNATLWASPITWIVAGVVALAVAALLIYKNWDGIAKFFGELWNKITAAFGGAWNAIKKAWGDMLAWLSGLPGKVKSFFADGATWLVQYGEDIITGAWEGMKDIWADLEEWGGKIGGWIKDFFIGAAEWLLELGKDIIRGLLAGLKFIWGGDVTGFMNMSPKFKAFFTGAISWLLDLGKDILRGLLKGLKWLWDMEITGWMVMGTKFKEFFTGAGSWLYDIGKSILTGLLNGLKAAWNATADFLAGLGRKIKDLKGPIDKDRVLLYKEGEAIIAGLGKGMESQVADLLRMVSGLSGAIGQNMFDGMGAQQQRLRDSWSGLTAEVALAAGGGRYGDARDNQRAQPSSTTNDNRKTIDINVSGNDGVTIGQQIAAALGGI